MRKHAFPVKKTRKWKEERNVHEHLISLIRLILIAFPFNTEITSKQSKVPVSIYIEFNLKWCNLILSSMAMAMAMFVILNCFALNLNVTQPASRIPIQWMNEFMTMLLIRFIIFNLFNACVPILSIPLIAFKWAMMFLDTRLCVCWNKKERKSFRSQFS